MFRALEFMLLIKFNGDLPLWFRVNLILNFWQAIFAKSYSSSLMPPLQSKCKKVFPSLSGSSGSPPILIRSENVSQSSFAHDIWRGVIPLMSLAYGFGLPCSIIVWIMYWFPRRMAWLRGIFDPALIQGLLFLKTLLRMEKSSYPPVLSKS